MADEAEAAAAMVSLNEDRMKLLQEARRFRDHAATLLSRAATTTERRPARGSA